MNSRAVGHRRKAMLCFQHHELRLDRIEAMPATFLESSQSSLSQEEEKIAHESSLTLARHALASKSLTLNIVDEEQDEPIVLPAEAVALLLGILRMMASGLGIALTPLHSELTTKQAADILHVSRPYLIKLLDAGDIPYHKVGTHRRIRREDVMTYKRKFRQEREAFLDRLVAESQELGLYD